MITIKKVQRTDLPQVLRVEKEAWPEGLRADLHQFSSRWKIFPQGFFAAYEQGTMVGASTSQRIDSSVEKINFWNQVTGNGLITTHQPRGQTLYVVSIGVSESHRGNGIGSLLLNSQIDLARTLGLRYLMLGSRLPDYHLHRGMSIDDYIHATLGDGQPLDRELRFYVRAGLKIKKIVPNYMLDDPESLNYGVIMSLTL